MVEAYRRHYQLSTSAVRSERLQSAADFWASERVNDATEEPTHDVIGLLRALANAAPDDRALCYLGAGPVEDLLRCHGDRFIGVIDDEATVNARLQTALRCAWFENFLHQDGAAPAIRSPALTKHIAVSQRSDVDLRRFGLAIRM